MNSETLKHVNELIECSNKLGEAIRFLGGNGIDKPTAFTSGNFAKYYEEILHDELNDTIIAMCRGSLVEKRAKVDIEIRKYISDWSGEK